MEKDFDEIYETLGNGGASKGLPSTLSRSKLRKLARVIF